MTRIQEHLRRLGVGIHLKGYRATVEAVSLAIENEDRLQCAQEALFKPIAANLGCDFRCVERNIRTAIDRAWRCNPAFYPILRGSPWMLRRLSLSFWTSLLLLLCVS